MQEQAVDDTPTEGGNSRGDGSEANQKKRKSRSKAAKLERGVPAEAIDDEMRGNRYSKSRSRMIQRVDVFTRREEVAAGVDVLSYIGPYVGPKRWCAPPPTLTLS